MIEASTLPRLLYVGDLSSLPSRRLEGVTYAQLPLGLSRWMTTRVGRWVATARVVCLG